MRWIFFGMTIVNLLWAELLAVIGLLVLLTVDLPLMLRVAGRSMTLDLAVPLGVAACAAGCWIAMVLILDRVLPSARSNVIEVLKSSCVAMLLLSASILAVALL